MRKFLLFILLICPMFVGAVTYDTGVNYAADYMNTGDYKHSYSKYIVAPTNDSAFYSIDSAKFKYGGLISKKEFMITLKDKDNINYSYLYESNPFWTLTKGDNDGERIVIDLGYPSESKNSSKLRVGTKVTEYVKNEVKVMGFGTYNDPFIFAPQYKVLIKVNNSARGVIVDNSGNDVTSIEFLATESDFREIKIKSKGKYGYIGNTCGFIINDIQASSGKLILNNVTRDTECVINFGEKASTVILNQEKNDKVKSNPEVLYVIPDTGWFSDEFANYSLSKLFRQPERVGYTYKGYFKSSNLNNSCSGSKVVGEDNVLSRDKTLLSSFSAEQELYPCYQANTYTVTYNLNTGDKFKTGSSSKTVTFGQLYGTLSEPEKTGYTFDGWWTDPEYGTEVTSGDIVDTAQNHTLYAHWTANTNTVYTVNHWLQNIGAGSTQNATNYTIKDTLTPTGTSDTYVSAEIKSYKGFTSPSTTKTVLVDRFGNAVINYYYLRNSYIVRYSGNGGGTPNFTEKTLQFGEGYPLPTTSRVGYTFDEWNTSENGSGSTIGSSSVVNIDSDHTLYAQWNINQYDVELTKGTGIKTVTGSGSYDYDSEVTINATLKSGYLWSGWTGDYTSSTKKYKFDLPAKDVTLKANAVGVPYSVTYDCNGGKTPPEASDHVYGTASAVRTNTCVREGFKFVSWNTQMDGSGTSIDGGANVSTLTTENNGIVPLYAQWVDNEDPKCSLKATSDGVTFATKNDNVGVSAFGLIKSTTATYNSKTTLELSNGTFYGYVKDAAGNTYKCSITIGGTKVTAYEKVTSTCDREVKDYTKTTKTCKRKVDDYTRTIQTCKRGTVSKYTKTTKTCSCSYTGEGDCMCNPTSYNPNLNDGKDVANGNTSIPNAGNNLAYVPAGCDTNGCLCPPDTKVVSNNCKKKCSFGSSSSDTVTSCTDNTFTCSASYDGDKYVSCDVYSYNYSFKESTDTKSSCSEGTSFKCNKDNKDKSYVSDCKTNYKYEFESSTDTVSSCTKGTSFTCNKDKKDSSYVSGCSTNYKYDFETSKTSVTSCTKGTSFTCNSDNYEESYVSKCTPTKYECSDSDYTMINNTYCYK